MDFSLAPLIDAVPPIPSHALVAMLAAAVGAWQLLAPKGGTFHRVRGYVFVAAMAYVAVSAIFISEIRTFGYLSPIHILIPVTLLALWRGVFRVRRGEVKAHARIMATLFVLAIAVTGLFTFWPGRIMHEVVFGAPATAAHEEARP